MIKSSHIRNIMGLCGCLLIINYISSADFYVNELGLSVPNSVIGSLFIGCAFVVPSAVYWTHKIWKEYRHHV